MEGKIDTGQPFSVRDDERRRLFFFSFYCSPAAVSPLRKHSQSGLTAAGEQQFFVGTIVKNIQ